MKSKIISVMPFKNDLSLYDKKYTNLFTSNADISLFPDNVIDENYPKENLFNPHIFKECKISKPSAGNIGIIIDFNDNSNTTFDTIVVQINKNNENFWKHFKTGDRSLNIYLQNKANPSIGYNFWFGLNTEYYYVIDKWAYSQKFSFDEGLFLIDKEMFDKIEAPELKINEWDLIITTQNFYTAEGGNYLPISNIVVSTAKEIKLDQSLDFTRVNLNDISYNKKTGISFVEKNDEYKLINTKIKFFRNKSQLEFDEFMRYNKDYPVYFFPYCDNEEFLSDEFDYSITNFKWGGLYNLDLKMKLNLEQYNSYNTAIELREYK